jgi:hypothetical protein
VSGISHYDFVLNKNGYISNWLMFIPGGSAGWDNVPFIGKNGAFSVSSINPISGAGGKFVYQSEFIALGGN